MSLKFKNIIKFICIIIYLSSAKLLIAGEWTIFEGFESNSFDGIPDSLVWTQGGDADWVIDSDASEGSYSARSGVITHSQTSTISTTAEIPYLPGKISFSFKTSTEPNYDKLKFYVDGVEREQWDGINSWTNVEFVLNPSPNTYTFTWEYYKDGSVDTNDDAVWIDDIRITGHEIVVNAGAPIDTVFIHDGVLGGNVQLDGSGTYPDENADLSVPGLVAWFENQMNWYLSNNLDSVIATGVRPIVNLDCIMSEDDNLCIGNHTIVLKIEFSGFSESSEVSITTTEPNQAPILEVSSSVDTLTIANNNGIPGNSTSVNLMSQFFDQIDFYDPDTLADGTQDDLSLVARC